MELNVFCPPNSRDDLCLLFCLFLLLCCRGLKNQTKDDICVLSDDSQSRPFLQVKACVSDCSFFKALSEPEDEDDLLQSGCSVNTVNFHSILWLAYCQRWDLKTPVSLYIELMMIKASKIVKSPRFFEKLPVLTL